VIFEVAHRYGDEMLLWDGWRATEEAPDVTTMDELARLLVRADASTTAVPLARLPRRPRGPASPLRASPVLALLRS